MRYCNLKNRKCIPVVLSKSTVYRVRLCRFKLAIGTSDLETERWVTVSGIQLLAFEA